MSIAATRPPSPPQGKADARSTGADQLIEDRISEACSALWWAEVTRTILQLVMIAIGILLAWIVVDQWIYSPGVVTRLGVFAVLAAGLTWYGLHRIVPLLRSTIQPEYAARSLEHDMPELRQSLTSYVTLRGDRQVAGLRNRIVRSMGAATAGRLRAHDALPAEATGTMRWWIATAVALAVFLAYAAVSPKNSLQSAKRLAIPLASIDAPRRVSIEDVQPGDVDAIAGRVVEVSASIDGMRGGEEAYCRWDLPSGRREVLLDVDGETGKHAGEIELPHSASGDVRYVISAGDATAGPFRLRVQDVPVVALEAVRYEPPKYTGQAPHSTSSGAITALDGTGVTIQATTNRPVARAKIEFNPRPVGQELQATAGASEMVIDASGLSMSVSFPLRSSRGRSAAVELESYRIKVWDAAEQSNPDPIIYPIRVIADLPPEVSITMPLESPQDVPINAQQIIEVHASDPDFGLTSLQLELRSGGTVIAEPVLWSDPQGAKGNRVAEYPFRPANHDLPLGSTVQVVAIAIDNRSDENDPRIKPNVRRTDAVELRVKAAESLPPNGDPNAGGLSAPEDSEANEERSQSDAQQGDQQSGGGGGAGQGQQQQGDSQEGGQSSSGGQSGEEGEGQTGEGQTGEGESGEGQTGEGKSGEGQTGEGQTGEGQTGEGQTGEGQTGESQTGEGQTGEGQGGSSEAPKHDGETFERIRDYIEKQRQQQSQGGASDAQGESESQKQSGSSPSSEDAARESGAGQQPSGDASDSQGSSSDSAGSGEKSGSAQRQDSASNADGQSDAGSDQPKSETGQNPRQASGQGDDAASGKSGEDGSSDASNQDGAKGEGSKSSQGDGEAADSNSGEGQSTQSEGQSPSGSQSDGNSGQPRASERGQSESSSADAGEGGEQSSDSSQSSQQDNDGSRSGDNSEGQSSTGEGQSSTGEDQSSDGQSGDNEQSPSTSEGQSSDRSKSAGGDLSANPSQASGATGGAGVGGDDAGQAGDAPITPDPVDLDYAKKATDMVLDYLQETRDAPDEALLDELKWSKEDLRKFSERWQRVREMSEANRAEGGENPDVREALESLGLRSKEVQRQDRVRDSADSLRTIRDAGNRKPPPPAFRDAFDAFRRAMGRQD